MPPATAPLRLEYVREPDVSEQLDRELRELISSCFAQPRNAFFSERRYAQQMPQHRYLLRNENGQLVAHLAIHDKVVSVAEEGLTVGGLAEVCVHESLRGQGQARRLLDVAHAALRQRGVAFALLFGEPAVYTSSGYQALSASIRYFDTATQSYLVLPSRLALCKPLTVSAWPDGPIDLRGPMF